MPNPSHFSKFPPFPSDSKLSVADIVTLSLEELQAGSGEESAKLYEACRKQGFFFLDLNGPAGKALLKTADKTFDLVEKTLTLDHQTVEKYACDAPRSLIGYKRKGMLRVDDNTRDSIEVYTISQDDILGNIPPLSNPNPIESNREALRNFCHASAAAVSILLGHLDKHLDLPPGTLSSRCPTNEPSASATRLLRSQAQLAAESERINFGGHTDIGIIITFLFNVTGGLQIMPTGSADWAYVRPRPNTAFVVVADTLTESTGGLLRSSLHRVVLPPPRRPGPVPPPESGVLCAREERCYDA